MKKLRLLSKRVATCTLALVLTVTFSLPYGFVTKKVSAADDSKKKAVATDVHYYPTDDVSPKNRTGIKSFTLDPYTYYNMSKDSSLNPSGESTMNLNDATLKRIAENQIFPKWSVIAEGIFRDQANQLVTIEGSGMMSSNPLDKESFDRHFSTNKKDIKGYSDKWSIADLSKELRNPYYNHKGEICWDEVRTEGISQISSLADARKMMGQSLRNCSDDNDVSVDDFLGNAKQKTDSKFRLPDLDDDKSGAGFCNVVTSVNRAGASGDYDYVSFGLAVYDFDLTPVAAKNIKFVEAADKYDNGPAILNGDAGDQELVGISFKEDKQDGATTYLKNNTDHEATQSTGLENTYTEESSISQEESFEWGMEQTIGAEWNIGGFGTTGDDACMFPRCTLSISNSWHETWTTTKSQTQTKSTSKTKNVNTEVTLPGHTTAKINQSLDNKTVEEHYQQPVVLSYKVALFAMSGDYFNGWFGAIDNSRYDKQWMSIKFDGSDDYATSGCSALGSLYNRSVINKDTKRYDGAKGKYTTWCDKGAWNKSEKINWNEVGIQLALDDRDTHNIPSSRTGQKSTLEDMGQELPLMEKAMIHNSKQNNITSSVDQVIPLYLLGSVGVKDNKKQFDVKPGEKIYLDGLELEANNNRNVEFHGFQDSWGAWNLLDEDRNVIEDGSDKDLDPRDGRVKNGVLTLVTDDDMDSQWIEVANSGAWGDTEPSQYVKWVINDDAKIVTNENLVDDQPYMTPEQIRKVSVPTISINPKDESKNVQTVELSGNYKGIVGEEVNLSSVLKARAIDGNGLRKNIQLLWEDDGDEGLQVDESGIATPTKAGKYKVRAYCINTNGVKLSSDWLEIEIAEKAKLSSIQFNKPSDLDEDDLTITKKSSEKGFNLGSYISMYDQYGEKWTGSKPTIEFSVTDNDGRETEDAFIDQNNILTITAGGAYRVKAKAVNEDGEDLGFEISPIKLKITEEEWLESILFKDPALSKKDLMLEDKDDVVRVDNLRNQLRYLNQYGTEWTGQKPDSSFSLAVETDDAEIKDDSFFAYKPGIYKINANVNGYDIEPITIQVEEDAHLVIKTEDPDPLKLTDKDQTATVDLERYVDYTTQFDGKYDTNRPALNFSLDEDVEGAKIVIEKEKDDVTGEVNSVVRLKATQPGEYQVHVTPKKSSAYAQDIDDINVTVEYDKKVANINLDFDKLKDDKSARTIGEGDICVIENLEQYVVYYDQFGDVISPKELKTMDNVPTLLDIKLDETDKDAHITKEADGSYKFTAGDTGTYKITIKYEKDGEEVINPVGEIVNIINENTSEEIDESINDAITLYGYIDSAKASGLINDEQEASLKEAMDTYIDSVNNASSTEDILRAKEVLSDVFNKVWPEIALEIVKDEEVDELNSYKNPDDYREAEVNMMYSIIDKAEDNIYNVQVEGGDVEKAISRVFDIADAAKEEIDKLKTDADYRREEEESTTQAPTETTKAQPTTKAPETTKGKAKAKKPGTTAITKAKKKKSAKKLKVTLKKATSAKGYQVAVYKTKKNAKANKKALVKKTTTKLKLTIKSKKLKGKKKVYVRARAFNYDGSKKVYSTWSKVKKSKVK